MTVVGETNAATGSPVPIQTEKPTAAATAAADFKNFLTLLTAQLKHQDPLSPLDSTQFVEQLASFSAVEQQIETNKLLRELMGDSTKSDFENAAVWIGKEVEAETPQVTFDGEPIEFRVPAGPDGAAGTIVVRNASGETVYSETMTAGKTAFMWDGKDDDGIAVANGVYKFAAEFTKDDATAGTKSLFSTSRVAEVRFTDGELKLGLDNGAVITADDVTALREPPSDVLAGDV